jgi:hypothetical protein
LVKYKQDEKEAYIRTMKRITLLFGLVFFMIIIGYVPINSLAYDNEPDGFGGIKWGTKISTLKGMSKLGTDPSFGGIDIYIRKGEELKFGDAKLSGIQYGFWKGKFADVRITVKGKENWPVLKNAVFAKYGKGNQADPNVEKYAWFGTVSAIGLEYMEASQTGLLYIVSTEISKEQKEYKEK